MKCLICGGLLGMSMPFYQLTFPIYLNWGKMWMTVTKSLTFAEDCGRTGRNNPSERWVCYLPNHLYVFECVYTMNYRGMIRNQQATSAVHLERPLLSPLWAAGFSFSKCHAEIKVFLRNRMDNTIAWTRLLHRPPRTVMNDETAGRIAPLHSSQVPNDPSLPRIFDGEEFSKYAR